MTDEVKTTNEPEAKEVQTEAPTDAEATIQEVVNESEQKEKTVSELMEGEVQSQPKEKETVGLDKFLDIKKENKELKKALKDLESRVIEGDSDADDVASDIDELAEKFNVDKKFLKGLEKALMKKANDTVSSTLKPLQDKERQAKMDTAFNAHYEKAISRMPDFENVANKQVIKSLSQLPENSNKTFSQLIEETYGNAISGKRTIETTTPHGGKSPDVIDYSRANTDSAYFKEIMASPDLKAKYNSEMLKRIQL